MSQIPPPDAWRPHPDPQAPYGDAGSFYPDATAAAPYGQPGVGSQPTFDQPAGGAPGYTQAAPGYGQPASPPPAYGQPGYAQPAHRPTGHGQPAYGQPGYGQAGYAQLGYGPYPPPGAANPWAAPPPRKRRAGLIVLAAVLGLVVLCGGGLFAIGYAATGGKSGSPHAADTPTADPSSAFIASTAPAVPDGKALKAHLLAVPAGAETLRVSGSTNGVFSLDQFVTTLFDGSENARSMLERDGFEVAAEEDWAAKGVETHLQLIQFQNGSDAFLYGLGQEAAFEGDSKYTATTLTSVPNGHMYELKGLDSTRNHEAILMAQVGPVFIVAFFFAPGALNHAAAQALVKRQSAALGT